MQVYTITNASDSVRAYSNTPLLNHEGAKDTKEEGRRKKEELG